MARSITEIFAEIEAQKNAEPNLAGLTSNSATAIWRLWAYIIAMEINIHEQLLDVSKAELEQLSRDAVAGSADWLRKRVLEFQFSALDPQFLQVINSVATYPVIDPSLRIITRVSVLQQGNNRVLVKVAKGTTNTEKLSNTEITSLKSYLDKIAFVGVPLDVISLNADRLRFAGTIFFNGEYTAEIVKANVITAINNYLALISQGDLNGVVVREKLIDAIQATVGVTGVDTLNVSLIARAEQDPLGNYTNITVQRLFNTYAGYIIAEDTVGNTLEDLITMQPG